jgi:hypothetical protein
VALLVTDTAIGIAALALLPPALRAAVRTSSGPLLRALLASALMAAAVWPLRGMFLPIPVLAGVGAFGAAAYILRVFTPEEVQALAGLVQRAIRRRPTSPAAPMTQADGPAAQAPVLLEPIPDRAVATASKAV